MDVRALHSPPRRLEITRKRRRAPRVCVRLLVLMPVWSYLLTLTTCLSRHGINSPHEPEDLFLFAPNQDRENFVATYPVEPPKRENSRFNWCTLCVYWASIHVSYWPDFQIYYHYSYSSIFYIWTSNIVSTSSGMWITYVTLCNPTAQMQIQNGLGKSLDATNGADD